MADAVAAEGQQVGSFMRHCRALHEKNMVIAVRNKRATLMQLFASFFFMLFVYIVDVAVQTQQKQESRYSNVPRLRLLAERRRGGECDRELPRS